MQLDIYQPTLGEIKKRERNGEKIGVMGNRGRSGETRENLGNT
jgi:hypothetical protein